MSLSVESSPLPNRHAVRTTIEDLIGRDVTMTDGVPVASKSTNIVAVYVTDRLFTTSLVVCDLECGARIGGCLGMVPKGAVDDAISARDLPKNVWDNCYEVLNVLSAVFNVPNAPHVRLYEMYGPGDMIPGDVAGLAGAAGSRMDVKLSIQGYGLGQMSIVTR